MSVAGDVVVVVIAAGFVLVNGINDGGTLIANGLKIPTLPPLTALMVLTLAVATVPLVVGTAVADTLGARLVTTDGATGQRALVAALLSAIGVVLLLARRGLPTSLTLATIGAIAGSGIGTGSAVAWDVVGLVLHTEAQGVVTATVNDGHYAAWWPDGAFRSS
jgi:inorganic phosphate transporter, PiT family